MRQIVQSYKDGKVSLREVPVPKCGDNRVLVRNRNSLISIGTERSTIELGRKSLLGKAAARPDLVRRAWDKAKKEGLLKTWQEAMGRLDTPTPLGYSCAGVVEECGIEASEFSPGDRVACLGQGFASHAEYVSVPVNLACRLPDVVSEEEAAFGMLGIIALHGIRKANLTFGSRVTVVGLGLLGLITIQILRAYGCDVVAYDPAEDKVNMARRLGIHSVTSNVSEMFSHAETCSKGAGMDAVVVTAATTKSDPVDYAIQLCRINGKIVVVGTVDIHPDRNELWQKQVELVVSKAAGPGSLDPLYELEGVDLPIEDVRWTQKRNLEEFIRLIEMGKVDVLSLVTHRIDIIHAEQAYTDLISGELRNTIGVILEYNNTADIERVLSFPVFSDRAASRGGSLRLGVLGAGLFGKSILIPILKKIPNLELHTLVTESGVNTQHSGSRFGFKYQSTDPSCVWKNKEIDAIVGLTPHSQHAPLVKLACKHSKKMFMEKPLCTTVAELNEIKEMYLKQSTVAILQIGHNRRFSPHTLKIQEWLRGRSSPLVAQFRVNAGFVPSTHWVHSEKEGRSRIVGEMSHFIDFLQSLIKSQVARVYAERISGDNQTSVNNDNVVVVLKFSDGSVASLNYSASGDKSYFRESLEVFSEGNTIVSRDFRISELHRNGKVQRFKTRGQEMGYKEELNHFVDCSLGQAAPLVSLDEMFGTMETIFAIEHSLATTRTVSVNIP